MCAYTYAFPKIDENCCIMYVCSCMVHVCTLHAEGFLHYYGEQTLQQTVSSIVTEVHMYPYIIIIIRTEYVYVYICTVLFAGGPISGSGKCHSYCMELFWI